MRLLAKKITLFFISKGKIEKKDFKKFVYCFEIFISDLLNSLIVILSSIIFNIYLESIIFTFCFFIIRKNIGGYHAKTHFGCSLVLIIMYLLFYLVLKFQIYQIINLSLIIISFISFILIMLLAPVSHPNNELEIKSKKKTNILALLISGCILLSSLFIYTSNQSSKYTFILLYPLFFCTINMILGYIKYKKCF